VSLACNLKKNEHTVTESWRTQQQEESGHPEFFLTAVAVRTLPFSFDFTVLELQALY